MAADGEYCAFTKSLEHLGDRRSLLIVRDLMIFGTLGFNALAAGLPGISRSVLATRLRDLAALGVVARSPAGGVRPGGVRPGYRLTAGGEQLRPVVMALRTWAERWLPEDPAMLERDPDVVVAWLARRIDPSRLPDRQVVIDMAITGTAVGRCWMVLERDAPPSICVDDPGLSEDCYVFVESDVAPLAAVGRGTRDWVDAVRRGDIRVFGAPDLIRALPDWLRPTGDGPMPGDRGHAPG
jgi:DNA-binding HxlR family transcriptional regulator